MRFAWRRLALVDSKNKLFEPVFKFGLIHNVAEECRDFIGMKIEYAAAESAKHYTVAAVFQSDAENCSYFIGFNFLALAIHAARSIEIYLFVIRIVAFFYIGKR